MVFLLWGVKCISIQLLYKIPSVLGLLKNIFLENLRREKESEKSKTLAAFSRDFLLFRFFIFSLAFLIS